MKYKELKLRAKLKAMTDYLNESKGDEAFSISLLEQVLRQNERDEYLEDGTYLGFEDWDSRLQNATIKLVK